MRPFSRILPSFAATILTLTLAAHAQYPETVLYNFESTSTDAAVPEGILNQDALGNVYGAAQDGGAGGGAIFELSPSATGWTEQVLYGFTGSTDGKSPNGGLIFDASGNIYGTTGRGGSFDDGVVFELSPTGTGTYTETVLYNFTGSTDGEFPTGGIVSDSSGNLYGTTARGGTDDDGVVFKLSFSTSTGWTEKVLYSFTDASDGAVPDAGIVADAAGNLYGTTFIGGNSTCNCGTVFRLTRAAGFRFTVLHQFNGFDGSNPLSNLTFDSAGNAFGSAFQGGTKGYGTIYELTPTTEGYWKPTILHSFTAGYDGASPLAPITLDSSGNVYGTNDSGTQYAFGTAFELTPIDGGGWNYVRLHAFTNGSDGGGPRSNLLLDASGNIYGTTATGGTHLLGGTFYELTPPPAR